jgi:nicotinate-nucleotide adenylyltransferase
MIEFFTRAADIPARLGILPGTFNPPTSAHLALAEAGLAHVEEVLFVLPRVFPHKSYAGIGFDQRRRMVDAAVRGHPRFSVAATEGGLFVEIARECRAAYGAGIKLAFLCGRDAAERIVNWDYGTPGAIMRILADFELLMASRKGTYAVPNRLRSRIHELALPSGFDSVSASEVRRRVAKGLAWEELVPPQIVPLVREFYRPAA